MYFKEIELKNFRNYKEIRLSFDEKLNLFLGENAQGKTNLLESLFIMGLGKSFRTSKDSEMIYFNEDFSDAKSLIYDKEEDKETSIQIIYQKEGKIVKVDGIKLDRSIDLLENVYIVVFSPDDLKIIKEGPENRRKFLDRELCQIKPVYYSDLGNYKRILKQRNILLKQRNEDKQLFSVFDESLANYGLRIIDERAAFTDRLRKISERIHLEISSGKEILGIEYETKTLSGDTREDRLEEYKNILSKNLENDLYKGFTSFGPHKDDLKIDINGTDLRVFGSQGQQRTAALSMKLAEIDLIKQETGKDAVLLLDDVLSELDQSRQRFLIESMKNVQVFVTSTEIDPQLLKMLPEGKIFYVKEGSVESEL